MGEAAMSAFLKVLLDRVGLLWGRNLIDRYVLSELRSLLLKVNKVLNNDAEVKQITNNLVKEWLRRLQDAAYESNEQLDAIINAEKTHNKDELSISKGKLKEILQEFNRIFEDQICLHGGPDPKKPYRQKTSLKDEDKMYGRHNDRESIVKLLLDDNSSDNSPDVITIIGMGGIGKTTLAQHVYDHDDIVKHFDFQAWFCVSEGLNVFNVTKTILEKATLSRSVTDDLDHMQEQLRKNLVGKKFLVVLDDVWEEDRSFWDLLKKPLRYGLKRKVLVTTRNEGVAQIMGTVPTHYLEKLSDEDCWNLFAKYAFEGGNSQPHQSFIVMGREITKKCDGLPLAAKEFGNLLRNKKTIEEWSKTMESNVWDLKCNIISELLVSYQDLPARLKCCFAFASIFPKGYKFEKEELIQLWAAQSFFPEGENAQDTGNGYFNELISRSFFQQSTAGSVPLFVMHDLMHDLATLASGQSCRCCVNPEGIQGITETTRHMSYSKTVIQFLNLPNTTTHNLAAVV